MVDILLPYQKGGNLPKFVAIAMAFTTQMCLRKQESLELMSKNDGDAWIVHPLELEAIIGLWLWSLKREPFLERADDSNNMVSLAEDIKKRWIFATGKEQSQLKHLELELDLWVGRHHLQLSRDKVKDCTLPLAPAILWSPSAHPRTGYPHDAMHPVTRVEQQLNPQELVRYFNTALLAENLALLERRCSVATTPRTSVQEVPVDKSLWIASVPLGGSLLTSCAAEMFCSFLSGLFEAGWEIGGETRLVQKGNDFLLENTQISEIAKLFEANGLGTAQEALMRMVSVLKPKDRIALNAHDGERRTRLSHATEGGDENLVRLLLEIDTLDPHAKDENDRTPLSYAAEGGYSNIVKLLLDTMESDVDAEDNEGRTPLSYAAESGHAEVVELLFGTKKVNPDSEDYNSRRPLLHAAKHGHEAVVERLLREDVDADARDDLKRTPLSYAEERDYEGIALEEQ